MATRRRRKHPSVRRRRVRRGRRNPGTDLGAVVDGIGMAMSELEKRVPASKARKCRDLLVKAWDEVRELERLNPPARKRLPKVVEVYTWFERDRAHVEVRDPATDKTVIEWWDEDVAQAVEDGFLKRRGHSIESSAVQTAIEYGLLPPDVRWSNG